MYVKNNDVVNAGIEDVMSFRGDRLHRSDPEPKATTPVSALPDGLVVPHLPDAATYTYWEHRIAEWSA